MFDEEPRERNATCSVYVDTRLAEGIPRAKCALCKGRFYCGHVPCPLLSSIRIDFNTPPVFSSRVEDGVRDIIIDQLEPDTLSVVVGPCEVVGDREERFEQLRRSVTATMERERIDPGLLRSIALSIDTPRVALDIDHHSFRTIPSLPPSMSRAPTPASRTPSRARSRRSSPHGGPTPTSLRRRRLRTRISRGSIPSTCAIATPSGSSPTASP